MSLTYSLLLQAVMVAIHIVNSVSEMTEPGEVKMLVAVAIGTVQLLLHWYAAGHNPDGTSSAGSYR